MHVINYVGHGNIDIREQIKRYVMSLVSVCNRKKYCFTHCLQITCLGQQLSIYIFAQYSWGDTSSHRLTDCHYHKL